MARASVIGREIRAALSATVRDVMLLAEDNLKNATPVDTTNAANNWVLTVGRPFQGTDGSRQAPSDAAQRAGEERIKNYDVGRDGPIYIRNNVTYVQYLDRGHSQQAPAGFVAMALAGGSRRAPRGTKQRVTKMLRQMARRAYIVGA